MRFRRVGLDVSFHDPLIRAGREVTHLCHRVISPAGTSMITGDFGDKRHKAAEASMPL
jgi:hypothetical protein